MGRRVGLTILVLVVVAGTVPTASVPPVPESSPSPLPATGIPPVIDGQTRGLLHEGFIENRGQYEPSSIRYVAGRGPLTFGFSERAIDVLVTGPAGSGGVGHLMFRMHLEGRVGTGPIGGGGVDGTDAPFTYIRGTSDGPAIHVARRVRDVSYLGIYPGTDLVYTQTAAGPKYEFRVAPGADVDPIRFRYEGVEGLSVEPDGSLRIVTLVGDLVEPAPVATSSGGGNPACVYRLIGPDTLGFSCPGRDQGESLVIDPLLLSTFVGGAAPDTANALATDTAGNIYLAGVTSSPDFPTTPGVLNGTAPGGGADAFVAKLAPDGSTLTYATFLGGNGFDAGYTLSVDAQGRALVGGIGSDTFPTTPGTIGTTPRGSGDAFVARLDATGSALVFSTLIGGSDVDDVRGMAVASDGSIFLSGITSSADLATTAGAFQPGPRGGRDGWAARIAADATTSVFVTYLGGADDDSVSGMRLVAGDRAAIAGASSSTDLPAPGGGTVPYRGGVSDGLLAILQADGSGLQAVTLLGGGGEDRINALTTGPDGALTVAGITDSQDFPTTPGAVDAVSNGSAEVFVATLDAALVAPRRATLLGGDGHDYGAAVAVDGDGRVLVGGATASTEFPVTPGAIDITHNGFHDALVVLLDANLSVVLYGTFLGGTLEDSFSSIIMEPDGDILTAGITTSKEYPTTAGAYDASYNGAGIIPSNDVVVVRIDPSFSVPIRSVPPGRDVTVDSSDLTTPATVTWRAGTTHVLGVDSPQAAAVAGSRFSFTGWDDGIGGNRTVVAKSNRSLEARFVLEHRTDIATEPPGLDVVVDSQRVGTPVSFWWPAGSNHTVLAPSPQAVANVTYAFFQWADGGDQSRAIEVGGPLSLRANYSVLLDPDYSLEIAPPDVQIQINTTGEVSVRVVALHNYSSPGVRVALLRPPPGVSGACSPEVVAGDGVCTLRIAVNGSAPPGDHTLTVRGSNGTVARDTTFRLEVIPAPDFALRLDPVLVRGRVGDTLNVTVLVLAMYGYAGAPVNLSLHHVVFGVLPTFVPSSVAAPGSCRLALRITAEVPPGTYEVPVQGQNGTATRLTNLTIIVSPPPPGDFRIAVIPAVLNIAAASEEPATITVTMEGFLAAPIILTAEGLPPGMQTRLPPPVTKAGSYEFEIGVEAGTPPTVVRLRLVGTSGSIRREATLEVRVVEQQTGPPANSGLQRAAEWVGVILLAVAGLTLVLAVRERPRAETAPAEPVTRVQRARRPPQG